MSILILAKVTTRQSGDPHFEMEKIYIYIAVVQIVARLQIVMLDDTGFDKI